MATRADVLRAQSNRCGYEGYFRILAAIRDTAKTCEQISAEVGVSLCTVSKLLRGFRRMKVAHRERWQNQKPYWLLGGEGDVACGDKGFKPAAPFVITLSTLLLLLQDGPHTRRELASEMGLDVAHVGRLLVRLKAHGLCHRSGWDASVHGHPMEEFMFGPGRRAPRLPVLSSREQIQRWRRDRAAKEQQQQLTAALCAAHANVFNPRA
jgi:hypothetical protein